MMVVDTRLLTGSDARATVAEQVAGDAQSLTGATPFVSVREKVAGLPNYVGMYVPDAVGPYALAVRQLTKGGLAASYFDNQWLLDAPSVERVDPALSFDWGSGAVTPFGRDYVSARWVGKLVAPATERFTFFVTADDGVRVWVNHTMVVDAWATPGETRADVNLTAGAFTDIKVPIQRARARSRTAATFCSS